MFKNLHVIFIGLSIFTMTSPLEAFAQYKYEHKYGANQYNYDVEGSSDYGSVTGNVDTNGKYVEGYIADENGNESYFEGEWSGYGTIEGYDDQGNFIELEVE